ncbi:MAG: hypothetical protein MZW92_46800 [Comamonadaceae bacterium]|nr:hypothetical protein [Comamonadaceae bacterium]
MSEAERSEHRSRMLGFKTYDECKAYMDAHRKQIEQRANERHTTLRPPQADACDDMKARGLIK